MNSERLTWEQIEERYDQEWVELVDYDWPDELPDPKSGIVRVHSADRDAFHEQVMKEEPVDSAIVFVGLESFGDMLPPRVVKAG